MHDPALVGSGETKRDLNRDVHGLGRRQWPPATRSASASPSSNSVTRYGAP